MKDLQTKIQKLKREKNAIILAHYYVPDEVQAVADFVGDSFYLAKLAVSTKAQTLIFCGVHFMGESAKILNPEKKVLLPEILADCPMAHMASIEQIKDMRSKVDDLAVVCYINSTAELKSHCDVCVTSSNALKIVRALKNKNILFIPDDNLGGFVAEHVPEKTFYFAGGCCPIHANLTKERVLQAKAEHPNAEVLIHPECKKEVVEICDHVGSTADIIKAAKDSCAKEFIVCTESGVLYELKRTCPDKKFYIPQSEMCCPDMKAITLEKVYNCLKCGSGEVILKKTIAQNAYKPLHAMLELSK